MLTNHDRILTANAVVGGWVGEEQHGSQGATRAEPAVCWVLLGVATPRKGRAVTVPPPSAATVGRPLLCMCLVPFERTTNAGPRRLSAKYLCYKIVLRSWRPEVNSSVTVAGPIASMPTEPRRNTHRRVQVAVVAALKHRHRRVAAPPQERPATTSSDPGGPTIAHIGFEPYADAAPSDLATFSDAAACKEPSRTDRRSASCSR